ncbi:MAG: hypothetical protein PPP58_05180 [Natronomonas sp.]
MIEFPIQLVDDFLLDYHLGHAVFLLFLLAVGGGFAVTRSMKVLGINLALFGLLFVLIPGSATPAAFTFFGIALLVVGPVVAVAAQ